MPLINPPADQLGRENAILGGRARRYEVARFTGPLSIKAVLSGTATWETAAGRFDLGPAGCLIVNDGEQYTIRVEAPQPVETFCIFFQRGFVEDADRSMTSSSAALLDAVAPPPIEFAERLNFDGAMREAIVRASRRIGDPLALDASIHALALQLVRMRHDIVSRRARLPVLRSATREELRRRLDRSVAIIHGRLSESLPLATVSRDACLSTFHFHRLFTSYFGETPHRYIRRLRLQRAAALLRGGSRSVSEVALDCGFESVGSFTTLFSRHFGISPGRFRSDE